MWVDKSVAVGVAAVQGLDAPAPAGAQVIHLSRETVLPGMIDVRVHLTGDAEDAGPKALTLSLGDEAVNGVPNARKPLPAGFTTARNVGASHYTDVALRNALDAGKVPGPRLQVSAPPLGATGGHADENLPPPEFHSSSEGVANGPWELRAREHVDFVMKGGVVYKAAGAAGAVGGG